MKSATDGSGTQKISTKNYGPNMQKKDSKIVSLATANLDTVAVRFPKHKVIRSILKFIDFPLAMPSANLSSGLSPVNAFDVFEGSVPESQIHKESEYIPSHWNNSLWSYSSEAFIKNCKSNNLDLNKIKVVKGLFEDTLTSFDQNIETASVIFFDSDFYNSTLQALKFSKKFMSIGTILVFDDYFRFRGKENYGPHGAFKKFCEEENIKFREFDLYKGQIVSYICSDIK